MRTVSVILTTFNSSKYLQRTLDSFFNQTGLGTEFMLEIIVVDDCSTDNTLEILVKNKIKFFTNSHNSGGPNRGRNLALKNSTGDFIIIADHDDVWMPNRILTQLKYAEISPIVSCGYKTVFEGGKEKITLNTSNPLTDSLQFLSNETFKGILSKRKRKQTVYLGSLMFQSKLKTILFEEHFGQIDFDWLLKLFHNNESIEVCEVLYLRFVSETNLSMNETYRLRDYNYSLLTLENYRDAYPSEVNTGRKRINGTLARYYYLSGEMKKARRYFIKSEINLKTIMYLITSFLGHRIVVKNFNIFG